MREKFTIGKKTEKKARRIRVLRKNRTKTVSSPTSLFHVTARFLRAELRVARLPVTLSK